MATITDIRNRLIDSLMAIDNADFLMALEQMIESSNVKTENLKLTEEQKLMLAMSNEDIKNGDLIDQDTLNDQELEWLRKK